MSRQCARVIRASGRRRACVARPWRDLAGGVRRLWQRGADLIRREAFLRPKIFRGMGTRGAEQQLASIRGIEPTTTGTVDGRLRGRLGWRIGSRRHLEGHPSVQRADIAATSTCRRKRGEAFHMFGNLGNLGAVGQR